MTSPDDAPASEPASAPEAEPARKPRKLWRKHVFTPDMHASLRHRYEQTAQSIESIARYAKVSQQTIRRYAEEGQWTRFVAPPRGIPEAAKLAAAAAQLARSEAAPDASAESANSPRRDEAPPPPAAESPATDAETVAQAFADHLARLNAIAAGIDKQIAVLRARQMLPQAPDELRENARTLEELTAGASHIHHLLEAMPQGARADDSTRNVNSSGLDGRRHALAHRIESLVAEWLDAENAAGAERG